MHEGIKYDPNDIHPRTLVNAKELFLTGTAAEIAPVVKVKNAYVDNGKRGDLVIGDGKPGPITLKILNWYREETLKPENGTPIYENESKARKYDERMLQKYTITSATLESRGIPEDELQWDSPEHHL